jgi:CBS domain-containing protein
MSTIRDVLDRKGDSVLTIEGQTSVFDAIRSISNANVGAVVIQDGEQPSGIFTERDYLRKITLEGRSSRETAVAEVMSSPLFTVEPTDNTRSAMETMTEKRCRHLVVMESGKMVGIVSLGDLVKHLLLQKEEEVEQLSSYISGNY